MDLCFSRSAVRDRSRCLLSRHFAGEPRQSSHFSAPEDHILRVTVARARGHLPEPHEEHHLP